MKEEQTEKIGNAEKEKFKETESAIIKEFYRFRNGILATSLRNLNLPYPSYGLILPQLSDLASKYGKNKSLAAYLWKEAKSREARLLAILLIPIETISKEEIKSYTDTVLTKEEVEILSFKVLRYLPYSQDLLEEIILQYSSEPTDSLKTYLVSMFRKNLNLV